MAKKISRGGAHLAKRPVDALDRMRTIAGQREVVAGHRRDPNPAGPNACGIPNPMDCSTLQNCRFGNRLVLASSRYLRALIARNIAAGLSPAAAERAALASVRCEVERTNIILEHQFGYPGRPLPTMADWVAKGTAQHQP